MIVSGHVKENRIVLDTEIVLPNGLRVEVIVPDELIPSGSGLCGIWRDDRAAEEIVSEILSSRSVGRETTL